MDKDAYKEFNGGVTAENVEQWKKQHGKVFCIEVEEATTCTRDISAARLSTLWPPLRSCRRQTKLRAVKRFSTAAGSVEANRLDRTACCSLPACSSLMCCLPVRRVA